MWKTASQARMWERNALPRPWPSCAPLTRPAMSTTLRYDGTLLTCTAHRHTALERHRGCQQFRRKIQFDDWMHGRKQYGHIHIHTQPFNSPFSRTTWMGHYQKKHSPWSSDILYQLPPSTTIHSILLVQFMCFTVLFYNLSPGPLWSSSWSVTLYFILHTFFHPIIIFLLSYVILLPYAITVI